ncbi:MAG TPA: hypothetical protein VGX02_07545 [Candidatus Eremiobacteraceae bacterium]|nr:hypothetical protein [Candidatus Eremiobacteraceae bacterium]
MKNHHAAAVCLVATVALLAGAAAPASAALRAVNFVSATTGWVGGDGVIWGTTDGGKTWQREYTGRDQIWSLSFVSPGVGYAAGIDPIPGAGIMLGTADGGKSWNKLAEPRNPARQISFGSSTFGLAMAGGSPLPASGTTERIPPFFGGRLAGTSDGARSWRILDATELVDSACVSNPQHPWAAYQAAVLRSDDGGDTFSNVFSPQIDTKRVWYAMIGCAASDVAWVQFTGAPSGEQRPYIVYRTIDGGKHWQAVLANKNTPEAYPQDSAVQGGPGPWPGPFAVVDANTAYFVGGCPQCGTRGAVSITGTSDGGKSWQSVSTVPDVTLAGPVAVSFGDANHGWIVGSSAAGAPIIAATADGGLTWTKQGPSGK